MRRSWTAADVDAGAHKVVVITPFSSTSPSTMVALSGRFGTKHPNMDKVSVKIVKKQPQSGQRLGILNQKKNPGIHSIGNSLRTDYGT